MSKSCINGLSTLLRLLIGALTLVRQLLEALPVVVLCPENGSNALNNEELCANLSEEEIAVAISQLRNGRALGLDEVSG